MRYTPFQTPSFCLSMAALPIVKTPSFRFFRAVQPGVVGHPPAAPAFIFSETTKHHPCQTLVFIKKPQILFLLNFRMYQASAKWPPQLDPLPLIFQSQVELRSKHLKKFQASCCLMVGGLPKTSKTIPQQIAILKLRTLFLGAH